MSFPNYLESDKALSYLYNTIQCQLNFTKTPVIREVFVFSKKNTE